MNRQYEAALILLLITATSCHRPSRQLSSSVTVKLPPARTAAPGFSAAIAAPDAQMRG
ncbi:hypothetical protein [Sphingomonas sp.]|uniref:hypothetical protein n=1 Tax=Sphingomonas sp. TaxID=28214 RepID=UPI00286CDBA4|nr:hypothetical protein [Sphingomonas sp.]